MPEPLRWAGLFLLYTMTDGLYTNWMYQVTEGNPMRAGITSAAVIVLIGIATISYTQNPWRLIPIALGSFVGTALVVWWNTKAPPDS